MRTSSVCGTYWINSNSSARNTTEPGVTAMSSPSVNASGSTIDGTRGAAIMSSMRCRMPRTALSPPVSINAFQPRGLNNGLLVGDSPSVRTSKTNRIRSPSRQSRAASEKSWFTVLLVAK